MIYSINYVDMAEKLNPLAVSKYLDKTGWTKFPVKRMDIKIFQITKNNSFKQVIVPLEQNLRDYKQTMYDTVRTIAEVEERSIEQVMLYLLNPNTDILKIRMGKKDIEVGNILLDDAIQIYDNAKKLLEVAALEIKNPKKIYMGRPDISIQNFLNQCRFGQTEIGSYIVSVVCPFAELTETECKQLTFFSDEQQCADSLTRKVINRLMRNIFIIKQNIDDENMDQLDYDKSGISGNFYKALGGLNLQSENTVVEFTTEWSPIVKTNRFEHNHIKLTHNYYQPIKTIFDKIKGYTEKRTDITGRIKSLSSTPIIDDREKGTIVIVYIDDEYKAKSVTVTLGREDYTNAVDAHQHGKTVRVVGNLKNNKMNNAIFSVID